MKKIIKPFWSYDVEQTEDWLQEMAEQGYILKKLNRASRTFYFEQAAPQNLSYQISFDRNQGPVLASRFIENGWTIAAASGKWQILQNSNSANEIKAVPVRQGVITHNRNVSFVFFGLLFYLLGVLLANLSSLVSSWLQDGTVAVEPSPLWAITYLFLALTLGAIGLAIYSIVKIKKSNQAMLQKESGIAAAKWKSSQPTLEIPESSGRFVKKVKLGWMYAPDRLESWLEKMEQQGYQLHHVGTIGTVFYFVKGEPRRMSYHAEYMSTVESSYFSIYEDAGWLKIFESWSAMEKWVIWCREYKEGEEKPRIYSEGSSHLKRARRMAGLYTVLFLPLLFIYAVNANREFQEFINEGAALSLFGLLPAIAFVLFLSFIYRMWAYYIRLRKNYSVFHR
ncbi:hypothetical protein BN1080_00274 [Planococcus massiliensis]|uniref:DUF2812 domain-containing protein n=1 Tax=Planococcus massiliensis TaxID=1499687 RepID=A0A098EHV3_9BACL|nr:DUF2812 domain-containing protein [Planococcus massiliensis]CEG21365.1 hypothetical protein BN1080_00274 [Planococcus massiliensis]